MSDRTYNKIDARLYEEDWSQGARLIAGVLFARCPNQYGIFDLPITFLVWTFSGIYDREQILAFVDELVSENIIKLYHGGKTVWIIKKWKREQKNPSENNFKGALKFLEEHEEGLANDFKGVYGGLQGGAKGVAKKHKVMPSTDSEADSDSDSEADSEKKDSDKSEPSIFEQVVLKLFPDVEKERVEPQAKELERIHRLDNFDIKELYKVLKWGRKDDFWSQQFLSCAALRKKKNGPGDAMKWEKMKAGYEKSPGSKNSNSYHCPRLCDDTATFTKSDLGKPCPVCGSGITEFVN